MPNKVVIVGLDGGAFSILRLWMDAPAIVSLAWGNRCGVLKSFICREPAYGRINNGVGRFGKIRMQGY
jgi:hypothetical protein